MSVSQLLTSAILVLLGPLQVLAAAPSSVSLACSPNPARFGQQVTLTAIISPGTATGRVTFYDGVTVLGMGSIINETASLKTNAITTGTRSLRAFYGGDSAYAPSGSVLVPLTVTPSPANGFLPPLSYRTRDSATGSVTVDDFNGDGKPDLAATGVGSVWIRLGNGDGTFGALSSYSAESFPHFVLTGDFNGDGKRDLAISGQVGGQSTVAIGLGNGDATFSPAVIYPTPDSGLNATTGDFNGDGLTDIDTGSGVLLGNGDGTFKPFISHGLGNFAFFVVAGDFDADGKTDLAGDTSPERSVFVLPGKGDGTFGATVRGAVLADAWSIATGDFNGDGRSDLVIADHQNKAVRVLLGNGNRTFRPAVTYATGSSPYDLAVIDFDGDGNPDIMTANLDDDTVSVLRGNGDGTFQPAAAFSAGTHPQYMATGDFNGDGRIDLVLVSNGVPTVTILLGSRTATVTTPAIDLGGIISATGNTQLKSASPGSLISIYGVRLAALSQAATASATGRLPLSLAGTSVTIGTTSAPLLYVSASQVNALVPFDLVSGIYPVTVTTAAGGPSAPQNLKVTATAPEVFGGAVVKLPDYSVVSSANPFRQGDVLVIYCTGLGAVSPAVATGQLAPASPLSSTVSLPSVTIGGRAVQVANAVLSPGFVGLYQIGIIIPSGIPSNAQSLVVSIGGISSPSFTVYSGPAASPACADVSGLWNVKETVNITWRITVMGQTQVDTETGSGSGTVTVVQNGCSINYDPVATSGLIPEQLTAAQIASLQRTGTVSGNTVIVKGLLALIDFVAANTSGVTVSTNTASGTGQFSGSVIQFQWTGKLAFSGNFAGVGFASVTGDATSTATFRRPITTVDNLEVTLPATPNAVSGAAPTVVPAISNNSSSAFASDTSSDLVTVLKDSGAVTVTAKNVQPQANTNQIQWRLDRDPTDTIDTAMPALGDSTGPQTTFKPSAAGNFRLIAYVDVNGNGTFDEGEQLRVLRMAIVKATLQPNSSFFLQNTVTGIGLTKVTTLDSSRVPMKLQAAYLLEGGGPGRDIGTRAITIGDIGNLVSDTFAINYPVPSGGAPPPGNVAGTEVEQPGGPMPMVDTLNVQKDAEPNGGTTAFRANSNMSELPAPSGGRLVQLSSFDAPEFSWDSNHPTTTNSWGSTAGANSFRELVVAFSNSFRRTYLLLHQAAWTVNVVGVNKGSVWVDAGSSVTGDTAFQAPTAPVQAVGLSFVRQVGLSHTP